MKQTKTLQEAVDFLEARKDIKAYLKRRKIPNLTSNRVHPRSSHCPVAKYLQEETGEKVIVTPFYAYIAENWIDGTPVMSQDDVEVRFSDRLEEVIHELDAEASSEKSNIST